MADLEVSTLAEKVDEYLAFRQIDRKKYFPSYMIAAKYAWKALFQNTIYAVQSEWKELKIGEPYNYIEKPRDAVRVFNISDVNASGQQVPLFYDNTINIIPKPASSQKKCSCTSCDCSGLCDDVNSLTYTTKVLFTINGTDYIEKTWVKVCPNGDIIEYRIVPVKKYHDYAGDSGDYMNDYMNDFDIGHPPFSNYDIVYLEFQRIICKLQMKPCGCPDNIQSNVDLLIQHCGCFLPCNAWCNNRRRDKSFLGEINGTCRGSIKVNECGDKFYYIPHRGVDTVPEFLLINYQTGGAPCNEIVQVPDYADDAMFCGIDWYSKRFNNSYSQFEKNESKYAFNAAQNDLILFLNNINLEWLSTVQDAEIRY